MIIAAIAVIWIGSSIRGKRQEKQLIGRFESLMDDSRYKRALEILQEHVQAKSAAAENASDADASVPAETDESSADDGGYQAAIQHLVDNGIDRAEAEENLNFVLSVLVASSQSAA